MSNGDPNTVQAIFRDIFGRGKSSALTSKNNEVILKLVKMHILEMEDVLFHLNSAVLMPGDPRGDCGLAHALASARLSPACASDRSCRRACLDVELGQVVSQARRALGHPLMVALWFDPS